jgi:hypothetical protein
MEREALIKLINRAMRIEEEAVPAVTQHIISATEFLEKDPKIRAKVEAVMNRLQKESEGHADVLNKVLATIEKEKKNVY